MPRVKSEYDDGFRRSGGRGRRGWGGKLNNNELMNEVAPSDKTDERELHKRLSAFHQSYFSPEVSSPATFESIGMASLQALSDKFEEYDTLRSKSRKNRDPKRLADIVATLLGLKNVSNTAV